MEVRNDPFADALRHVFESEEVPRRIRIACKAVWIFRQRNGLRSLSPQERRLLAMTPAVHAGRMDVDTVLDVVRRILTE